VQLCSADGAVTEDTPRPYQRADVVTARENPQTAERVSAPIEGFYGFFANRAPGAATVASHNIQRNPCPACRKLVSISVSCRAIGAESRVNSPQEMLR
jgi:hypothetical protein